MKVIGIIKNIILDLLIVLMILAIAFIFINKKKPIPIFDYYFFTVMTGSMQDELNIGDNIIVKKADNYEVGDIITYKKDNIYVTHRIVKIEGNSITTKGDANTTNDVPFNKENILGKYVKKSKLLNFVIRNKILICLVIIIIYLLDKVIRVMKNKRKVDNRA